MKWKQFLIKNIISKEAMDNHIQQVGVGWKDLHAQL